MRVAIAVLGSLMATSAFAQHTYIQYPNGHRQVISTPHQMQVQSPVQRGPDTAAIDALTRVMMAAQMQRPQQPQVVYVQPPPPQPIYIQQPPVAHPPQAAYYAPQQALQPATGAYSAPQARAKPVYDEPEDTSRDDYIQSCMGYGYRRSKCVSIWDGGREETARPTQPSPRARVEVAPPVQTVQPQVTIIQSEPLPQMGESHVESLSIQEESQTELMDVDNEEYKARREQVLQRPDAVVQRFTLR